MASLVKRLAARMMDPQFNENFYKRVNSPNIITDKDKSNYALAHEAFQKYKNEKKE
ncbi:hypothetical protein ACFPA1_08770 [Neobacillus sp. GCM10023253]|uniref:hypothetical protein n=1 Tax=Neobacillus sp. GCM10023253 TaxID=3252644 RepID=UPI00360EBC06